MKLIPLSALKGACKEQLAVVRKTWPNGIPVTAASAKLAVKLGLDLDWLATRLLSPTLLAEYSAKHATLLAEYDAKHAPLLLRLLKLEGAMV